MKVLPTAAALAGLIAGCLGIALAGQKLATQADQVAAFETVELDAETEELARQAAEGDEPVAPDDPDRTVEADEPEAGPAPGDETATETRTDGSYQRIAPRKPLSDLALAQPPKPKKAAKPEDWKATRLFNPVATSAGVIEAQGYRVALSGIEPTPPDENCDYAGRSWPCGARARTAFRAWLRARAIQCTVPPTPDRELITAECRIGKEDLSAWLVASGWARAVDGGPYAEAAGKARDGKIGLFGPPPAKVNVTLDPGRPAPMNLPPMDTAPAEEPALGPAPEAPAVPVAPVSPLERFPPPPPAAPAD